MTTAQELIKLVDLFTHDLCEPLALQLHIKTQKPIYAIYDPTEKIYRWGINYWHYFIKVGENSYLNARGLHTEEEMIAFWANAWNDPSILNNARIVPHTPKLEGTGDPDIDRCITARYGDPTTIQPHTIEFADLLLKAHNIS